MVLSWAPRRPLLHRRGVSAAGRADVSGACPRLCRVHAARMPRAARLTLDGRSAARGKKAGAAEKLPFAGFRSSQHLQLHVARNCTPAPRFGLKTPPVPLAASPPCARRMSPSFEHRRRGRGVRAPLLLSLLHRRGTGVRAPLPLAVLHRRGTGVRAPLLHLHRRRRTGVRAPLL